MTKEEFINDRASEKVIAFINEIEQVCIKHKFILSVSGYDKIEVWDLMEGECEFIHANGIEDMTEEDV